MYIRLLKVLGEILTSRDPECLIYNNINEIFFHSDWNERTAVLGNTMQKGRNLEKRRSSSASADVGCKENEGMRTDE